MRSLVWTCAVFTALGLAAPVSAKNAEEPVEQTALAIPRIGMPGARGVALPQPLSTGDAALIRHILALQKVGAISGATREMERLDSDLLRGAILSARYIDTAYIPDTAELSAWLNRYGDQPDAPAIRALLDAATHRPGPDHAEKGKSARKPVSTVPVRTLLVQNSDNAAVETALALLGRATTGPKEADSLFSGGVAAWRLGDFTTARPLFEASWRVTDAPALRAAAAFWAARVAHHGRDRGGYVFWLRRAARYPDTFYGPIARRALNPAAACPSPLPSDKAVVSNADVDALMTTPQGRRGFALLQVGEHDRAEAEFRSLWFDAGPRPALGRSLILVAKAVGLTQFADQLRVDSEAAEAAMGKFELPLLRPAGGFIMDPAFVYAVVRHESNFRPLAVSPVGARGLMQLMPRTAVAIGAIAEGQSDRLNDPSTNLMIGQRYLVELGGHPMVGDDLLKVIAAYGQGPSGMNRWAETVKDHGDPFVFLEAIPSAFMRQFVEDVLVYHWQYAAALRLRASSLDELANGVYPRFTPIKATRGGLKAKADICGPAPARG